MKKKLLSLLFTSLLFVGVSTVKASTDINDWTVTVEAQTGTAGASVYITIDGDFEEGYSYYAKFVNEGDEKPITKKDIVTNPENTSNVGEYNYIFADEKKIHVQSDWYLYKGYDYVYFLKCENAVLDGECEISEKPVKAPRPELPELDQRYDITYYQNDFSIKLYPFFPYLNINDNMEKTFILKVGLIEDKELLYSLYKKQSGSLEKLLKYAEEDDSKNYEVKESEQSNYVIDNLKIVDGEYYYIYTTIKDKNDEYRDLRGVAISMANEKFLSNDVKWTIYDSEEDSSATVEEEKVEKNPSTADTNIALILGALAVCGSLIVIGKKKISAK